jgi:tRNA A37 methylthiotransferase MiaB
VPNDYKYLIADILEGRIEPHDLAAHLPGPFSFTPALRGSKTRAGLKIQDGCGNYCAYCIIPYTRGASVSRPADEVLREFRLLRDHGYREIVLTGVQVAIIVTTTSR